MQHRLTEGPLLNEKGHLAQAGFATKLVCAYERRAIAAHPLRVKEWDYYCISDGHVVLALTIADNGYMGLDSVSMIEVDRNRQFTWSFMRAFPMGKTGLPASSETGDVSVVKKHYQFTFRNNGEKRELSVHLDRCAGDKPLDAHITLTDPPRDSMVIATPFEKKKAFYYNQKINCLKASGTLTCDGLTHTFDPASAMAVLDWGRGVWTYKNTWYWSSLSAWVDGKPFGFNLGYGFGDTSKASENMLFYDGQAHKLDDVTFNIPKTDSGKDDFMQPWTVTDQAGRVKLTFTPALDRASCTSAIIIVSDQHQVFGYFDGTVTLDDGQELTLTHLLGFAEKVRNRW